MVWASSLARPVGSNAINHPSSSKRGCARFSQAGHNNHQLRAARNELAKRFLLCFVLLCSFPFFSARFCSVREQLPGVTATEKSEFSSELAPFSLLLSCLSFSAFELTFVARRQQGRVV